MNHPTVTRDFEADYWEVGDCNGVLTHKTPDEAIEEHLRWLDAPDIERDPIVKLYAYRRKTVDRVMSHKWSSVLESLLELLDEHYGNPEKASEPTDAMKTAHTKFVDAVLDEYDVWQCDIVGVMEVDLRKEVEP